MRLYSSPNLISADVFRHSLKLNNSTYSNKLLLFLLHWKYFTTLFSITCSVCISAVICFKLWSFHHYFWLMNGKYCTLTEISLLPLTLKMKGDIEPNLPPRTMSGFTWRWVQVDAVTGQQFPDELKVLQAVLHAVVHKLHVLFAHAAFDSRGHLHLMRFAAHRELSDVFDQLAVLVQCVHSLIKQDISVPPALLTPVRHALHHMVENLTHILSSKALVLHLLIVIHLALSDVTIIKLVPAVSFSFPADAVPLNDVRVIMTSTSLAWVDQHTHQTITRAAGWLRLWRLILLDHLLL